MYFLREFVDMPTYLLMYSSRHGYHVYIIKDPFFKVIRICLENKNVLYLGYFFHCLLLNGKKCIFYESLAICLPIYLCFLGKHVYKRNEFYVPTAKFEYFKLFLVSATIRKPNCPEDQRKSTMIFRTNLFLMRLQKLILYIFLYVLIMYLQFDIYQSHASPCLPPFKIVFFICCLTIWSYQIHMRN